MGCGLNRILYVEDDEDIAFLVQRILRRTGGFTVEHHSRGWDALGQFGSFAPDLLLLDVMMPQMDGPETLIRVRDLPGGDRVPVIFMTAKVQHHDVEQYKSLGALGVIPKPIDSETLCDTIRTIWVSGTAGASPIH